MSEGYVGKVGFVFVILQKHCKMDTFKWISHHIVSSKISRIPNHDSGITNVHEISSQSDSIWVFFVVFLRNK